MSTVQLEILFSIDPSFLDLQQNSLLLVLSQSEDILHFGLSVYPIPSQQS